MNGPPSPQLEMYNLLEIFFLAYLAFLATYLENYKSDPNFKCIKAQYNYFVIKYIIW